MATYTGIASFDDGSSWRPSFVLQFAFQSSFGCCMRCLVAVCVVWLLYVLRCTAWVFSYAYIPWAVHICWLTMLGLDDILLCTSCSSRGCKHRLRGSGIGIVQ